MNRNSVRTLMALLVLAPATAAWAGAVPPMKVTPESRLWVEGSSTVRGFSCEAKQFDAKVDAAPNASAGVVAGEKAVRTVSVTLPAAGLDCGNGTMNDHMLKAIKAKENPEIAFRLSSYELAPAGEAMRVTMQGTLKLGGVEKPVTILADAKAGPDGTLQVTGTHVVQMTEHGLKPPTLMMGTMKVKDEVQVRFDLFLKG